MEGEKVKSITLPQPMVTDLKSLMNMTDEGFFLPPLNACLKLFRIPNSLSSSFSDFSIAAKS